MSPRRLAWVWLGGAALLVTASARADSLCTASLPAGRAALCASNSDLFSDPQLIPSISAAILSAEADAAAASSPSADPRRPDDRLWKIALFLGVLIVLAISVPLVAILLIGRFSHKIQSATCPNCGSSDVRISFPEGFRDRVYALASCSPYRCKVCYCRYYHRPAEAPGPTDPLARLKVPKYLAKP